MAETAKDAILARIRRAVADASEVALPPRAYTVQDNRARKIILDELIDRLHDYKAQVAQTAVADLPATIARICAEQRIQTLAIPADLPPTWLPSDVTTLPDDPPLTLDQMDHCDGVLTGCELAIAQTGTIVLDGGATQGRRALSLVPDRHLCIVRAEQVVGMVPEGIAQLAPHATRPMTFISGPSATSDIELSRVEGVHGPRTLIVVLVAE